MSIDIMYNIHYVCNKLLTSLDCNSLAIQCRFCQMKLSLRGEYALRALLVLGLNYGEPVVRIKTISEQQNIPKRFLEQILNDLKSAGIVQSRRGGCRWIPIGAEAGRNHFGGGGAAYRGSAGSSQLCKRTV